MADRSVKDISIAAVSITALVVVYLGGILAAAHTFLNRGGDEMISDLLPQGENQVIQRYARIVIDANTDGLGFLDIDAQGTIAQIPGSAYILIDGFSFKMEIPEDEYVGQAAGISALPGMADDAGLNVSLFWAASSGDTVQALPTLRIGGYHTDTRLRIFARNPGADVGRLNYRASSRMLGSANLKGFLELRYFEIHDKAFADRVATCGVGLFP